MGSFGPLLSSGRCLESLSRKFGLQEEALYADMRLWAPRVGGLSPQNKGALPQHGGTEPHLRVHSSPVPLFCFSFQGTEPHLRLEVSFSAPNPSFRAQSLFPESKASSPIWEAQSWICRARRLQSTTSLLLAGSLGNRRHRVPGLSLAVCHRQL